MQHLRATSRHWTTSAALAAALLLAASAGATPVRARIGPEARIRPASACPTLFGSAGTRAGNSRVRAAIDWIDQDDDGVTIAHTHGSWVEPTPLTIRGVRLQGVAGLRAELLLEPRAAAALGCLAGRYDLRVDDSIGRWSRILAVLQRGVLVEHRGQLRYIGLPSVARPRFVMGWHLPGELRPDPTPADTPDQSPYMRYRTAGLGLSGLRDE